MWAATFGWWGFWLFRRCHGHFLLRDDFLGSLWHLKDISKITFRSCGSTRAKCFWEQKSFISLNLRWVTATCNRWDFWLFRRRHRYFLFRDNFFWSLRHLKDISKFMFSSYMTTRAKYFQGQKSFIFLNRRWMTGTCNRWGLWLFSRCHWCFLFRDNFLESLGHFKKSVF